MIGPLPPTIHTAVLANLHLLDVADDDPLTKILSSIQGDHDEDLQRGILCKTCGHHITHPDALLTINDKFIHCFTNPAGMNFEIQCYKEAPGILVSGKPTDFFSWFPGYCWQYSYCSQCNSHLGWFFTREEDSFYGLNIAMLKGEI